MITGEFSISYVSSMTPDVIVNEYMSSIYVFVANGNRYFRAHCRIDYRPMGVRT